MATIKSLFSTLLDAYTKNKELLSVANNAGAHNGIYRGIDLTTKYTEAQISAKIQAGDFSDLYIGDYIPKTLTIDGTSVTSNWTIAHFDYWMRIGGSDMTQHHVILVPSNCLYYKGMNASDTTSGGYKGSRMFTEDMPKVATALKSAFGSSHVMSFSNLVSISVNTSIASMAGGGQTGGVPTWSWGWETRECDLMTEPMVYGGTIWSSSSCDIGSGKAQLALFNLCPTAMNIRSYWWLSGVASSVCFCHVDNSGDADANGASLALGVRPFFLYH